MSTNVPERPQHMGEQQLNRSNDWNSDFPTDFDPYTWTTKKKPQENGQ